MVVVLECYIEQEWFKFCEVMGWVEEYMVVMSFCVWNCLKGMDKFWLDEFGDVLVLIFLVRNWCDVQ